MALFRSGIMKIPARRVYSIISELINEDAVAIIRILKNKSNVSEFTLAEEIDLEINVTRNRLYQLYDLNLVSFTRKKDQKKGWYIHYWTFNKNEVRYLILNYLKNKIEKIGERIKRENSSQFYLCENKCIRFNFEQSTDFEFKCPECGELLDPEDNSKKIKILEESKKEYEAELKGILA
jgi:transcription initiation factor TFIIE subunit alpha